MLSQNQPSDNAKASEDGGDGQQRKTGEFVNGEGSKEFLSTGRTGRRNALPDILGEHAETSTAGPPEKFDSLSTSELGEIFHMQT